MRATGGERERERMMMKSLIPGFYGHSTVCLE
jgi:hypothetical protein